MYRLLAISLGLAVAASAAAAGDMPLKAPPAAPAAPAAVAASAPPAWAATFATEVRYFFWEGTRGYPGSIQSGNGRGMQVYTPYAVQLVGRPRDDVKMEFLARGGEVWSRQSTGGLTGEVTTATDTIVSATFTYLGFNGVQPFLAVSTNLPTGRSVLPGGAANARMDPDLVEVSSFGEGFNVGPTVGVSVPITSTLIVTTSAGYTWRDRFPRERSLAAIDPNVQATTNIDPGEVFTATLSVGYTSGPSTITLTGSASQETATTENNVALYRPGRRFMGTGAWTYVWSTAGVTTLNASMAHSNRNEVLFLGAATLVSEAMNTNSNLYRVGIQHLFPFGSLYVGPTGSWLYRDHNGYDSTTLQFVPQKQRWTAGLLARYAATDKITLNARVDGVWTDEHESPTIGGQKFSVLANAFVAGSAVPVLTSTGIQAAVGANVRF